MHMAKPLMHPSECEGGGEFPWEKGDTIGGERGGGGGRPQLPESLAMEIKSFQEHSL